MTLPDSEVPGILVALPGLKDSYFEKTVILLFNYNEEGAMGLVMNHTSGSQVREILKEDTPKKARSTYHSCWEGRFNLKCSGRSTALIMKVSRPLPFPQESVLVRPKR